MRFGGQGLRALPPLQIEVSYCRLHAGINHLRFPTSLNQAATHWKEGGRTDSVSYFLPLCFFHHAFFVNFFASPSWCLHFASKDKMRGVFDSHISGNIVSWHSRSKVFFLNKCFFLNSLTISRCGQRFCSVLFYYTLNVCRFENIFLTWGSHSLSFFSAATIECECRKMLEFTKTSTANIKGKENGFSYCSCHLIVKGYIPAKAEILISGTTVSVDQNSKQPQLASLCHNDSEITWLLCSDIKAHDAIFLNRNDKFNTGPISSLILK